MERITATNPVGPARYGHEFRYRLAAGFIEPWDMVTDAACGMGYGRKLLGAQPITYAGIDNLDQSEVVLRPSEYWKLNLETWEYIPNYVPISDVFLGFETIEHLQDYRHFVTMAQRARKWILVSTPVVPTVGTNPHHVHDFKPGDLREIFENADWEHYQTVQQPSELSEIAILRRRA